MSDMIAFCGLDCAQCEAYKATQADDLAWKERVVAEWSVMFNTTNLDVKGVTCDGCTAQSGRWGAHCYDCSIRACGMEHGVENCASCPDYVCETLESFLASVPEARKNLEALRGG